MQVVGYRPTRDDGPALELASDADVARVALEPGTALEYGLGERRCAGAVRDGTHEACRAVEAPYCPVHRDDWPCARCRGDCDMPRPNCGAEHAIYLAAFPPDRFKVGVTRRERLETRLREQGAVRAAHLRDVETGRRARRIEAEIAEDVGDSVRVADKLAGLHREVDETAWTALLEAYDVLDTWAFEDGLDLDDQPVPATLATGTVRGARGRLLVLEREGTTYGVDLRDLVGHEVTEGTGSVDRQASLGAF